MALQRKMSLRIIPIDGSVDDYNGDGIVLPNLRRTFVMEKPVHTVVSIYEMFPDIFPKYMTICHDTYMCCCQICKVAFSLYAYKCTICDKLCSADKGCPRFGCACERLKFWRKYPYVRQYNCALLNHLAICSHVM